MKTLSKLKTGTQILAELQEFGSFPAATQRYIRRALQIRFGDRETLAPHIRNEDEARSLASQILFYDSLDEIEAAIPAEDDIAAVATFLRWLVPITAFDIAHTALGSFAAYRFLYERLLGPEVRPWLLGAFCTAASLPQLHPQHRRRLLSSIDDQTSAAAGWSIRKPLFSPQWVEQLDD